MISEVEQLKAEICSVLTNGGAAAAGIADLTLAKNAMDIHVDSRLKRFERAVSFIIPFPRSVIEELLDGPTHTYMHYYRAVNTLIDNLTIRLCAMIEAHDYEAFPVPSSQRTGKHRLDSIFPHRVAGYLAGMGWIGKSGCLVNPTFGSRVRLGTVLTTAPLPPDAPEDTRCGTCTLCTDACPVGAIKGLHFSPDVPLVERFEAELCDRHQNKVRDHFGKRVCGLCLAACPYGKPHSTLNNR